MALIREIPTSEAPLSLLLEADPHEHRVRGYLAESRVFAATIQGRIVGAIVMRAATESVAEIMNLVVEEAHRRRGIASALLFYAIAWAREAGFTEVRVGTGNSSAGPLTFYKGHGFVTSHVTRDYFAEYNPPIYENGIRCVDMVHLPRRISGE
jgi:GNAT superfamily N-acetyltransferase